MQAFAGTFEAVVEGMRIHVQINQLIKGAQHVLDLVGVQAADVAQPFAEFSAGGSDQPYHFPLVSAGFPELVIVMAEA